MGFLPEWQKKHNQLLKFQISHCVMIPQHKEVVVGRGILVLVRPSVCLSHMPCSVIIPAEQRSCWGVYWFHSVRPSVRLCRLPCPLCNIYSSGWILSILATNDHYHERVCRTQWLWPWPISSRSFGLDLENRVRSVAFTVLDGFFLYLAQMITIIRGGGVACYVFFRIWKFEFLANFFNFSALTLKKKSIVLDGFFPYLIQMITSMRVCCI